MNLILHIGTAKTGTTLIQNWLYKNQKHLSKQGIFLSNGLGKTNNRLIVSYFQKNLDVFTRRKNINSKKQKKEFFEGFEERVIKEFEEAAKSHHTAIITSEHFHSKLQTQEEVDALKTFLSNIFDDIKVVCYFREQSLMRESLYSTSLKLANIKQVDEKTINDIDILYYDFYQLGKRWESSFGKEALDFRLYDRSRFEEGDIRRDFISSLGNSVDMNLLNFETKGKNESLKYLQAEAYRGVNKAVPYWVDGKLNRDNKRVKEIINRCKSLLVGKVVFNNKEEFSQFFEESNRKFFKEFFDSDEILFLNTTSEKNESAQQTFTLPEVGDIVRDLTEVILEGLNEKESFFSKIDEKDFQIPPKKSLSKKEVKALQEILSKHESDMELSLTDRKFLMSLGKRVKPGSRGVKEGVGEWYAKDSYLDLFRRAVNKIQRLKEN